MLALLIFPGGRRADAVLLSAQGNCLRLAVAGRSDVLELSNFGGRWISETGVPVEFGALLAPEGLGQQLPAERTMSAFALPC
jgi:hypothetical protein